MVDVRSLALSAIERVLYKNAFLNTVINEYLNKYEFTDSERALFTRLVCGTVEKKITLAYYLEPYLTKKQKPFVNTVLLMSIYQLLDLNIPGPVVVNASVEIAKVKDKAVAGFVNAVLRNFLGNPLHSFAGLSPEQELSIKYSYPLWLTLYLLKDYDYQTVQKIYASSDEIKMRAIRINTLKSNYQEVTSALDNDNIAYYPSDLVNDGLLVAKSVIDTDIFKEGKIVMQDIASQMVTEVLNPASGAKIIDLCAAPGGKSAHLAAWQENKGQIIACDIHPHKIKLMEKNFAKLGVNCVTCELLDARCASLKYPNGDFDYVLCDLPCSGLGVVAHKSDIKYHITYDAIRDIIKLQFEILTSAYPLIKKGGMMVVSTCTINKAENQQQIEKLTDLYPDLHVEYQKTIMPYEYGTDGFFICKLRKENA